MVRYSGGDDDVQTGWRSLRQLELNELRELVTKSRHPTLTLNRLDFLVKSLCKLRSIDSRLQRIENFVADFSQGWRVRDRLVADLNTGTTGELGVRLSETEAADNYVLPELPQDHLFEVCLRLRAHDVQFRFAPKSGWENPWRGIGAAYKFAWPTSKRPKKYSYEYEHPQPLNLSGLEFAQWFLDTGHAQGVTIIVLRTLELNSKARAFVEARRNLLTHRCILGIVDIPARISGSLQFSMLLLTKEPTSVGRPVLLVNGRAVDGLRDEPLDRLARFLSFPFMDAMTRDGADRQNDEEQLGIALSNRARKMYQSGLSEIPGFFRYLWPEEIQNSPDATLSPLHWIPERDPMVSSDLLDGTPVYKLLEKRERACCVYVIGNNGAGKSMLLRQLAKAYGSYGRPVRAIASSASDRFETRSNATTDYVYLGARTSVTGIQPRKLGQKLAELMVAIYTDRNKVATVNRVLKQLSFSGQHYLLPEEASSDLLESVRKLGGDDIPSNLRGWKLGFRKTNENSIVPFDHLSTGEQQLLLLIAKLVEYAIPGVVFLVDEPETSLHVTWQRALPSVFQTISRDFTCQIVIATHSPILISTSRGSDTFRFMADGGVLEAIGEQAASSVERVLFQGFDTYTENNREVHERCAELVARAIELANTERSEMLPEVLDELKQMERTVTRSIPSLGPDVPALHLELIRRAMLAITELARPKQSEGSSS